MNKKENIYNIQIGGLAKKKYVFSFDIDNHFFSDYSNISNSFSDADINVTLHIEKNEQFYNFLFIIKGTITSNCDRCLNDIILPVEKEYPLVIKTLAQDVKRHNEEENDPNIFYIHISESFINVRHWIYEFIFLSTPTIKKCADALGNISCNESVLQKVNFIDH